MSRRRMNRRPLVALLAAVAGVALIAGCGDDEQEQSSEQPSTAADMDAAFLAGMTVHHESAIEMARLAQEQAQHREVRDLADAIVTTQSTEIQQMNSIYEDLFGKPLAGAQHSGMGLGEAEMGMSMDPAELDGAKPFDRVFIDAMIEHHEGAIRMANIVLAEGEDPEVRDLASGIIAAQSREIDQMQAWRERWYGPGGMMDGSRDGSGTMDADDGTGH